MKLVETAVGRDRTAEDSCRRYLPIAITFDTRNNYLDIVIEDDWEAHTRQQHLDNKSSVRMGLLQELGTDRGDQKIDNYRSLGPSPFTVLTDFNPLLNQVRAAHAHGDFFPALVGACALGERLLNLLVLELRHRYLRHEATSNKIRSKNSFDNWEDCIKTLTAWEVLSNESAAQLRALAKIRNSSVHYNSTIDVTSRDASLRAIELLQFVLTDTFGSFGRHYIEGTIGQSYVSLAAEAHPFVQRFILPHCALVSPTHRLYPSPDGQTTRVFDDIEYDRAPFTDEQFAAALAAGRDAANPELRGDPPPDLFQLVPDPEDGA